MFTTRVSLRFTTMFTCSHANTPLSQSERVHYLSYFIKHNLSRCHCKTASCRYVDSLESRLRKLCYNFSLLGVVTSTASLLLASFMVISSSLFSVVLFITFILL